MKPRSLLVAIALALVLVALGVVFLWPGIVGPTSDLDPAARDAGGGEAAGVPLDPVLRPAPARGHHASHSGSEAAPEPAEGGSAGGAVLRVRIEAPGPLGPDPVRVRVEREGDVGGSRRSARTYEATDAVTEIPLRDLMRQEGVTQVRLTLVHPDLLDAVETVSLDGHDLEIVLRPRRALVVTGRTVRPDGTGFPSVGVFLYQSGPEPPRQVDAFHATAPDGRFRLKAADPGEYLLVTSRHGHAPTARRVTLGDAGAPTDVGDLEIGSGVAISGTLTFRGEPVSGAEIAAHSRAEGVRFNANGRVVWDGATLRAGAARARTDEDGRFTIEGLHPDRHRLRLEEWPHPRQSMSHEMRDLGEVSAPRDALRLEVHATLLAIRVVEEGRPVPWTRILLRPRGSGRVTTVHTDGKGRGTALLPPRSHYVAWVGSPEYDGESMKVETGAVGAVETLEIAVVRRPKLAVLRLRLSETSGAPIGAALIRCTPATGGSSVELGFPRSEEGVFRIDLPAGGVWHVRAIPGASSERGRHGSYLQAVETTVDLPEGGESDESLVVRRGGRIVLDVRDADGAHLGATVRVRDDRGALLEHLTWRNVGPRVTHGNASRLVGIGPATSNDVLAPGRYDVELDVHDLEVVREVVEVRAGETTPLEVRLLAR